AAVPFIEPSFEDRGPSVEPVVIEPSKDRSLLLKPYFPPGSWQLDNPIMFDNDRSKLLYKEYHNLDNGRVQLFPCTILFFPSGESAVDSLQRVIILDSPQGALLQFDGPFDPLQGKFSQLQGGQMNGPVTIHGTPSRPGANDALLAKTRDVRLTTEKISTDAPVDFWFGPNEGHGSQMEIQLLPSSKPTTGKQRGPNIGGLESFELMRDVQMRLVPGSGGLMPLDGQRGGQRPTAAGHAAGEQNVLPPSDDRTSGRAADSRTAGNGSPQSPVDIRCRGPFKFDMIRYVATFRDEVDVFRLIQDGPSDWMKCDWLSVYFAPKAVSGDSAAGKSANSTNATPIAADGSQRIPNLEPRRIEARGNPVILHGESNDVDARAEHLDYDIVTGQIALDDSQEVALRQQMNEFHGPSIVYWPGEPGRLGRLQAIGLGWLRGLPPQPAEQDSRAGDPRARQLASPGISQPGLPIAPNHRAASPNAPQFFEAHWSKKLMMRPDGENHLISLIGDARASLTGQGTLSSDEIHLWLKELPPTEKPMAGSPPPRWQVIADRMKAQGHVQIDSPQLTGATSQLEAWFEQAPPSAATDPMTSEGNPFGLVALGPQPGGTNPRTSISANAGSPVGQVRSPPGGPLGGAANGFQTAAEATEQRSTVNGDLIRLQLLVGGPATEVREAMVSGKPAEVGARGLEMYGEVVRMDERTNRIWIDGAGTMKLPESQNGFSIFQPSAAGQAASSRPMPGEPISIVRPTAAPDPMVVTWKDGMTFDGGTAKFWHSVVGESRARKFQTDSLEVLLHRRIDFSQPRAEERPEIERISFRDGMWMESRGFDPKDPNKLISLDHMHSSDLTINEMSGEILGQGPGWLTSVRQNSPDPMQPAAGPLAASSVVLPVSHTAPDHGGKHSGAATGHGATGRNHKATDKAPLNYLHVDFGGALSGNLNQHEITFHDNVRSVNGPVLSWEDELNPDQVDDLGPGGVLMNCDDRLTVRQSDAKPTAAAPQRRPIELEAFGNVVVQGDVFTAHANRLTYTEAKDLLTLEGDGRRDAELFRQERPGDPPAQTLARQIFYWRSSNSVSISKARLLDLNQIPGRDDSGK
ncbi:MAG TPA: hypothetical protein VG056_06230, partial [Pirellulales bacterium]|nr:hypothetical protein [Pirellulales bacterium]